MTNSRSAFKKSVYPDFFGADVDSGLSVFLPPLSAFFAPATFAAVVFLLSLLSFFLSLCWPLGLEFWLTFLAKSWYGKNGQPFPKSTKPLHWSVFDRDGHWKKSSRRIHWAMTSPNETASVQLGYKDGEALLRQLLSLTDAVVWKFKVRILVKECQNIQLPFAIQPSTIPSVIWKHFLMATFNG